MRIRPLPFLLEVANTYGGVVRLPLGWKDAFLITDPEMIYHLMSDHSQRYTKHPRLQKVLGSGLTNSIGELWKTQRRLITPSLLPANVAGLVGSVRNEVGEMVDRWAQLPDGACVDIGHEMRVLALGIAMRTMFGLSHPEVEVRAIRQSLEIANSYVHDQWARAIHFPEWLPLPGQRRFRRAMDELDDLVEAIIQDRMGSKPDGDSLLTRLLEAARGDNETEPMSAQQLRDEVKTLLVAGHETTATALTWAWYLISRHAETMARLREEAKSVASAIEADQLARFKRLTYTKAVIMEALRLYPPIWIILRIALADDDIGDYRIPRGGVCIVSPWVIHRMPLYWKDPTRFDPGRFHSNQESELHAYQYFPFGGGGRRCIGENFAWLELLLAIALVSERFSVSAVDLRETSPRAAFTLLPDRDVRVRISR
jgi:enediyne biosynthesis protein E7